jgi:pimeloyl-ACP methyl ester carboxylesterase
MKEKLLIIHGWTKEGGDSFSETVKFLKDDFEIHLIDLPGFKKPLERPYTFDDYLNYLETQINIDQFYLLGHSFGGALAMLYALKHPEKIKKLILYNPAIIREKNLKIKISLFLSKIFKFLEKIIPEKILYFPKKAYYKFVIKSYDYFKADENLKKTFSNIVKIDLKDSAKDLKVKTVLLWSKNDKFTLLRHGKILKNLISDSQLILLDGGHSFHKEKPEEFAKILKQIIKDTNGNK